MVIAGAMAPINMFNDSGFLLFNSWVRGFFIGVSFTLLMDFKTQHSLPFISFKRQLYVRIHTLKHLVEEILSQRM